MLLAKSSNLRQISYFSRYLFSRGNVKNHFENLSKLLSGRYDYDSLCHNVGVFKQKRNDNLKIFLVYEEGTWYITDGPLQLYVCYDRYLELETKGTLKSTFSKNRMTLEKNPLNLATDWIVGTDYDWSDSATVKIFSTKEEYENYELETKNQKKTDT